MRVGSVVWLAKERRMGKEGVRATIKTLFRVAMSPIH